MRCALLHDVGRMTLEDRDRPECPPDGMRVRVEACGVCATDVKIYNYGHHKIRLPRILGHEIAGVIDEIGPEVEGRFMTGQRVAVCAVINCGECRYCQRGIPSMCENLEAFGYHYDGGYQEYMAVPGKALRCGGVQELPDKLSSEEAAIAELLACSLNGQGLSDFRFGQSVLILGAGPVGILHAQLAGIRGCGPIVMADVLSGRLEAANAILGHTLTECLDASDSEALTRAALNASGGAGFDQVMVCCGAAEAQRVALGIVAPCGCVNFFGGLPRGRSDVTLDTNIIHYKQCRVVGTHGSSALENRLAIDLIARGQIDVKPLITHRLGLSGLEEVLASTQPRATDLKAVVVYP